jgi:hypothetical protein
MEVSELPVCDRVEAISLNGKSTPGVARMNEPAPEGTQPDSIVIDFIDPLFAVVLHISFVEIKDQNWFADFRLLSSDQYLFHICTLGLAYLTIITSWVGYHRSIKKVGISVRNPWGYWRFWVDITLLIAYFVLAVSFNNFRRELIVLVVVYFLFFIWDQLKKKERPEIEEERTLRRGVTVVWLFVFLILAAFYSFRPPAIRYECKDWLILSAASLATILYRVHKERLWWKPLLLALAIPKNK